MDAIQRQLNQPWSFSSGSINSPAFHEFFDKFKRSFSYQLRYLGATDITFNKGHFYISGFFKIEDQFYYFSLSDVREGGYHTTDWQGRIQLLMRTAEHDKDYTGGQNRYVTIKSKMYVEIAKTFQLELPEPKPKKRGKTTNDYVDEIIEKGYLNKTFSSVRKANSVAFALHRRLKTENQYVSISKLGRNIVKTYVERPEFLFTCDGESKRAEFRLGKLTDEQLIASLKLPKSPQYRRNYFTGEGETLEPLAVALHDKVKEWEGGHYDLFHQALLLFRTKYGEAYYTLLD